MLLKAFLNVTGYETFFLFYLVVTDIFFVKVEVDLSLIKSALRVLQWIVFISSLFIVYLLLYTFDPHNSQN